MECLLEQTSGRDRKDLLSFGSSYSDRCSFTKWIIYRHIIYRKASTGLSFRSSIHELLYTPGLSYKPEGINLSLPPVGFFIMSADIGTFCWNDACKTYIICTRCSFRSTWLCSPGCCYTDLSYGSVCPCVLFTTAAAACSLQRTIKWKQVVLEVLCFQSSVAARLKECPPDSLETKQNYFVNKRPAQ